jgi:hypothetical protein
MSLKDDINRLAEFKRDVVALDVCLLGHRFAYLPDHPEREGVKRCPHCMAEFIRRMGDAHGL